VTSTIIPQHSVDPVFGCWSLMPERTDKDGYSLLPDGRRAHRVVYEHIVGAIPKGMEIQHDCKHRWCFNPAHLRPVTRSENERLKSWRRTSQERKCPRGHDMFVNAMVTPSGGRICRTCTWGINAIRR